MKLFRCSAALAAALAFCVASPARASLVGFYNFNNPNNFGQDSSGNGNNLLIFGTGVSYTSSGDFGGALNFSGSGDLSTANGHAPSQFPVGSAPYTLSVDFKTSIAGALGLIGWGVFGAADRANVLRTSKTGVVNYWNSNDLAGVATVHDNAWHTAIAAYDGTTRYLYIDGNLVATDSPGAVLNNNNKNFGVGQTGKTQYFQGSLDDVAVFDSALTPAQVASALAPLSGVPEPGSVALLGSGLLAMAWQMRRRIC